MSSAPFMDFIEGLDWNVLHGSAMEWLRTLPSGGVHCIISGPPEGGPFRDLLHEMKRVVRQDGDIWFGDCLSPGEIRELIQEGSPEGGVVLDPFCGLGLNGVLAIQCGRRFLGIECRQESCDEACQRLDDVVHSVEHKEDRVRFLPSYVGSKASWLPLLNNLAGLDFFEPFCGSAVLSANLARTAILNDVDPYVVRILREYDRLIVPEVFDREDYFRVRKTGDWWKYIYCLQRMSFSGVFRYSERSGYNVPCKPEEDVKAISVRAEYERALKRFRELNPIVMNRDYRELPIFLAEGRVVVLDPPYQGGKAAYNQAFDYDAYWRYVEEVRKVAFKVVLFDIEGNIAPRYPQVQLQRRKMRVNGKYRGNIEAMAIL